MTGPNAGEGDWKREMVCDLSKIHYEVATDHLVVKCSYDGCTCCSNLPDSDMQLSIVPMVNPECFGFQPPGGW